MNKLLIVSIVISAFSSFSNSHAQSIVIIPGLIADASDETTAKANADVVTNAITTNTGAVTIRFPGGTYYFGKTIAHTEPAYSNRNIHIDIPQGTILKAAPTLTAGPIFKIDHADTTSYSKGSLCISGGGDCHYQNSTKGGVVDTSTAGSEGVYSDIGAFSIGNFASNIVQGLTITGYSSSDYSSVENRSGDTAIAAAGKHITVRFNTISGYLDAGVYVSGREVNGVEISELVNIQNNDFNNIEAAIAIKRGFKKALIRWNNFYYNTSDIGTTTVGVAPGNTQPFNAYPGREVVAYGNTSKNVRGQFFVSQWGTPHLKSDGSCAPPHVGALFRLYNTELAHIANNTISTCHQNSKVFAVISKKIVYGNVENTAHARCNTITNNNITTANNIIYEGSPQLPSESGYSAHSNWYTNNTINTNGTDVFITGGQWTSDKSTTSVSRNNTTQCVRSISTGTVAHQWWTGYGTVMNEDLVHYGACQRTTEIYPCDHYKITRP